MKARIPGAGGDSRANRMKKFQDMQEEMARVQAEVEASEFPATSGGGAVEVKVNGSHEVLAVNIKPEIVDPDDVELLSDMIVAAANEAIRKASDTMEQSMGRVSGGLGGLGIPGLG